MKISIDGKYYGGWGSSCRMEQSNTTIDFEEMDDEYNLNVSFYEGGKSHSFSVKSSDLKRIIRMFD